MRDHGNRLRHFANAAAMTCGPCPGGRLLPLPGFLFWVPSAHVPSAAPCPSCCRPCCRPAAHAAPTPITIEHGRPGPPVEKAWWSWNSQQVEYQLKRNGSPVRDTFRQPVAAAGGR